MEYHVQDSQGHSIAKGKSTNPYLVRNLLTQYITEPHQLTNPNTLLTPQLKIWCSAELPLLLQPTPRIIDNSAPQTPSTPLPLKHLCSLFKFNPAKARRILRKNQGSQYQRYEFTIEEFKELFMEGSK